VECQAFTRVRAQELCGERLELRQEPDGDEQQNGEHEDTVRPLKRVGHERVEPARQRLVADDVVDGDRERHR
jgi:hypothetical protein